MGVHASMALCYAEGCDWPYYPLCLCLGIVLARVLGSTLGGLCGCLRVAVFPGPFLMASLSAVHLGGWVCLLFWACL